MKKDKAEYVSDPTKAFHRFENTIRKIVAIPKEEALQIRKATARSGNGTNGGKTVKSNHARNRLG